MRLCGLCLSLLIVSASIPPAVRADVPQALQAIRAVGHNGAGHREAQAAAKELEAADVAHLTDVLAAMDGANPLALNWLSVAFESMASRAVASPAGLPVDRLLAFYADRAHEPRARRLAYEWIIRARPELQEELITQALDDPSIDMRRDAVARMLKLAQAAEEAGRTDEAATLYQQALTGAGDPAQVDPIVKSLDKLGRKVDRVAHYGLLTEWHVIGPFDNVGSKGFHVAYPPEAGVDLAAVYPGQKGEVKWERLSSTEQDGTFDIAALTAPHKGAVDYVTTEFLSDRAQPVEFRMATPNAWKLWLNGELLFSREEYHRGMRFDQYRVAGELKPGANRILIKICQNEQDQSWAQKWCFQFRICDPYDRPVRPTARLASSTPASE